MTANDNVRASITATLIEIEQAHKGLRFGPDRADYEAYEIVARIEVRLQAKREAVG